MPTRAAVPRRAQLQNEDLEKAGRGQKRSGRKDSNAVKEPRSWDPRLGLSLAACRRGWKTWGPGPGEVRAVVSAVTSPALDLVLGRPGVTPWGWLVSLVS